MQLCRKVQYIMLDSKQKKVLFLRFSSLGDIINANCDAMQIKKMHPEFSLTWMTDSIYADIIKLQPWVDGVIEWDRKNTGNRGFYKILQNVRHMGFDILVDMHATDRSSIFSLFSGIKQRYAIHYHFPFAHTEIGLKGLLGSSYNISKYQVYLCAPPVGKDTAKVLDDNSCKKLGLAIGASSVVKRWPIRQWIKFCRLASDSGYDMFLMGNGAEEAKIAEEITSSLSSQHIVNLVNRTSIIELIAVTAKMNAVVAGDTGLMHIARALGIPVAGLFGPNYPMIGDEYMKSLGICYFCNCPEKGCQKKECTRQCLEDIDALTVFEGVCQLLGD